MLLMSEAKNMLHELQKQLNDENSLLGQWCEEFFSEPLAIKTISTNYDNNGVCYTEIRFRIGNTTLMVTHRCSRNGIYEELTCSAQPSDLFFSAVAKIYGVMSDSLLRLVAIVAVGVKIKQHPVFGNLFSYSIVDMKDPNKDKAKVWLNYLLKVHNRSGIMPFHTALIYPHPHFPQRFGIFVKFLDRYQSAKDIKSVRCNTFDQLITLFEDKSMDAFLNETEPISVAI